MNKPLFRLYGRAYCHLCEDMRVALESLRAAHDFDVEVLDVDACPEALARYDELVPVLEHDGVEICHYFLDAAKVREVLGRFR